MENKKEEEEMQVRPKRVKRELEAKSDTAFRITETKSIKQQSSTSVKSRSSTATNSPRKGTKQP